MATKTKTTSPAPRLVIVTTKHRGVFVGLVSLDAKPTDPVVRMESVRMVIRFGTTRGLLQLAETGPTESTKISAFAPWIDVADATSIIGVSEPAAAAWGTAK